MIQLLHVADFCRDWLAAGGVKVGEAQRDVEGADALLLCAADGAYGPLLEAAKAAREAGCKWIGAVTRPGDKEGEEAEMASVIDAFVHMRADLPELVGELLNCLEGAR